MFINMLLLNPLNAENITTNNEIVPIAYSGLHPPSRIEDNQVIEARADKGWEKAVAHDPLHLVPTETQGVPGLFWDRSGEGSEEENLECSKVCGARYQRLLKIAIADGRKNQRK